MTQHSSSATAELLPCPFCGGSEVKARSNIHAGMSWVACASCGLEAPTETGVTEDQAVKYWNTRALAQRAPDGEFRSDVAEIALREIRKYCDENLGPSRSSLLNKIANIADTALALTSTNSPAPGKATGVE